MRESLSEKKARAGCVYSKLNAHYHYTGSFLKHQTPFQLLISVILSAQCTDDKVNEITPKLFKKYPDACALSYADLEVIKAIIRPINYYITKANNILKTAKIIEAEHSGRVPNGRAELMTLPGIGRKSANVILSDVFQIPAITVDTHVKRLSKRLGFSKHDDAFKIEQDLTKVWPRDLWQTYSSFIIQHGRKVCKAKNPECKGCFLNDVCPSAVTL
ncbi:endonuclease III [Thermoproteota archaeon]